MPKNITQIIDTFAQSTVKTMKSMCSIDSEAGAYFEKGSKETAPYDIAGLIGLTSATARGSIAICFPQPVFLFMLEKMLGEPVKTINRQNEDAAAEVMNIVFGDAKVTLNQQGHDIKMAVPSVMRGGNVKASGSKTESTLLVPFKTEAGEFFVEFRLAPLKESEKVPAKNTAILDNSTKAAFFKPFIDGTINALKDLCGLTATPGKPSAKKPTDVVAFDIAGLIGVTSPALNGSYMINFKQDVFLKLMSKMLGEDLKELQPGLEDGVCELLNITLGSAKVVLNDQQGHAIQMALPTLIHGEQVHSNPQAGSTTVVIPFYSDIGRFFVEVTIA